jgi:hypothetical protein
MKPSYAPQVLLVAEDFVLITAEEDDARATG